MYEFIDNREAPRRAMYDKGNFVKWLELSQNDKNPVDPDQLNVEVKNDENSRKNTSDVEAPKKKGFCLCCGKS